MKTYSIIILFCALVGCSHKTHITTNDQESKAIKGLYSNISVLLEDGIQKEFLYFDGNGSVFYMIDTAYSVPIQTQRIINYATKAHVSLMNDSVVFELDSFYIGKGTFNATVFNGNKINGEDKIYYHELMQKYSGIGRNDTLELSVLTVAMRKDTTYSKVTYTKYVAK